MLRLLAILSVAASTMLFAPAAPVPKGRPASDSFFPTAKGTTWVYRQKGCRNEWAEVVSVLSDVEVKGAATTVTLVTLEPGRAEPLEKLVLNDRGVFRVEALGNLCEPPLCLLKLPVEKGQTWEDVTGEGRSAIRSRYTVLGWEDVAVPAGRYRAVGVRMEFTFMGTSGVPRTEWYAPGVGVVKQVDGESVTAELKSFTPGAG